MDDHKIIAKVGGSEEGYLFEFCSDGVFLTVYPKSEKGLMFEMSDMRRVLKDFSVDDYDLKLLTDTLKENSGEPVLLGKKFILPKEFEGAVLDEEAAEAFRAEVQEAFPNNEIIMNPLSLSVSCHIGPGALAIACSKKINY